MIKREFISSGSFQLPSILGEGLGFPLKNLISFYKFYNMILQGSNTVIKYIVSTDIGLMSKSINSYTEEE